MIFVFGSNLAGRHGKGAALTARQCYGAVNGQGYGPQGKSFAIPTKDAYLKPLSLAKIGQWVEYFIRYAKRFPQLNFKVTAIGTGLAGYKHEEIAPLFRTAPSNCKLPEEWINIIAKLSSN